MRVFSLLLLILLPLSAVAEFVIPADKVENSVNIRLEPDAGSDIVGKLRKGESLPLVSSSDGWNEVELEGDATGFISADWSQVLAEDPVAEAVAEDVAEEVAVEAVEEAVTDAVAEVVEDEVTEAVEEASEEVIADVVEDAVEETVEESVDDIAAVVEATAETVVDEAPAVKEAAEEPVAAVAEPAPVADVVAGPPGPPGPPGPSGAATIKGTDNFLVKFRGPTEGGNSQVFDNGNMVGIGTTEPKQRLEVNGNIQIHEQNSSVAGLMITQSSGETGYIMHNRASTLTIGAGSQDRITIDRDGNVGIGISRLTYPLEMASGAHVTTGGVWTNRSSRQDKENISSLSSEAALAALLQLEPVLFNYRDEQNEDYVGFIAEDVPDLVATSDHQGLSAMDIVAVLTRVVQQQQSKIEELEARLDAQ